MNTSGNQKESKIILDKPSYSSRMIICPDCEGRGFMEEEYACGFKYPECFICSGKGRLIEITTKKFKRLGE
jgi:DnaJ-class molecular chaperone